MGGPSWIFLRIEKLLAPHGICATDGPSRSVVSIRNMLSWLHEDDEWLNCKYWPLLIYLPHKSPGVLGECHEKLSVSEQANSLSLH